MLSAQLTRRQRFSHTLTEFSGVPSVLIIFAASSTQVDDLLLGDSFAAGSGVNDDETLAVAMQMSLGRRVYNGAEIAIDLRQEEGRALFLELIPSFDVLIEKEEQTGGPTATSCSRTPRWPAAPTSSTRDRKSVV